jgi:hypothetical protein
MYEQERTTSHVQICIHFDLGFYIQPWLPKFLTWIRNTQCAFFPHIDALGCHQNATVTHLSFFQSRQALFDTIQRQWEGHLDRLDAVV